MTDRPDDPLAPIPAAAGSAGSPASVKPRKVGLLATIAATVVVLDLLTKIIVVATVRPNEP
ncbi:MAG TPA: signal peptidase II, partial [Nakamurella sp.]